MSGQSTEQELISLLSSDKRSLRIQAIVKLTKIGNSQETLDSLSRLLVTTSDREESFFISQAISKISQKLGRALTNNDSVSQNNQNKFYKEGSVVRQITSNDFLSVTKEKSKELLEVIRTEPNTIPEDVLPSVGVFLTKYGDKTDSDFIVNYLFNHHGNLALPYISAAERIDSKILIPVLPYLLASKESLVRSRAVMILRKIDSEEAERHFLRLLASKKAEDRLAALEISFLFPFERVKDYIIALLPEEKDTDVFKASATVLASNPSQEVALRILDVLETASQEQKKPINAIFNIVSMAIVSAKILPPEESSSKALVDLWKKKRLKKFLSDLEIQLCTTTGAKREGIINWIEKNRNIPEVAEFIEQLPLNPQTEDVYQRLNSFNPNSFLVLPEIDSIFEKTEKAISAAPIKIAPKTNSSNIQEVVSDNKENIQEELQQTKIIKEEPASIPENSENNTKTIDKNSGKAVSESEKEKIKYLKQLDMQEFLTVKHQILDLAEDITASVKVRAEALNTLLRLAPGSRIKNLGIKALEEEDTKLKTVGFKILERVSPDVIKMKLSDLLLSNDGNIRVRAIRFGLKVDQEKSIQALKKLVTSEDQIQRSSAISCLALCPFEVVYPILIEVLQKEKYPLVAKQITSILLNNPDQVILSILDKLSVVITEPDLQVVVTQARNELEEILASMGNKAKSSELKEVDIFDKSKKSEDKPYSVENVRKISEKENKKTKKEKNEKGKSNLLDDLLASPIFIIVIAIILVSIVASIVIHISNKVSTSDEYNNQKKIVEEPRNEERSSSIKTNYEGISNVLKKNKMCKIKVVVVNRLSDSSVVVKYDNRDIILKFRNKEGKDLNAGEEFNVTCIPIRENPNGIMIANCKKLEKIESNKNEK